MDKFEAGLKNVLKDEIAITENGACGFKTSGKKLLDLNFATSSLRRADEAEVIAKFSAAFYENPKLAVKWLFFARDVRGGMGERRLFKLAFKWLASVRKDLAKAVVPLIMEYGRADDMLVLSETELWPVAVEFIDHKIESDLADAEAGKPISLLAKWLPSVNTSSPETRALARKLCKDLELSEKEYRKLLSKLRAKLNVIETKTSANKWSEISYDTVPSQANLKYKNAFLKHDEARRREWLGKLEKGEAKINSGTLTVGEIVHKYRHSYYDTTGNVDQVLEAMWKALPTTFESTRKVIAVVDGSGSMSDTASGGISCHDVANGLGIYFAERLEGPFKNKFITFSETPQYVDISECKTLREKIDEAYRHCECSNTDIERTMRLILQTAIDNKLAQEDIPDLLILSDMHFDHGTSWSGCGSCWGASSAAYSARRNALFESIKKQFKDAGYQMPKISFWNICGGYDRESPVPVQQNELGVALISGFSQNILKMVMSNKTDPFDVLVETRNGKRYDAVEQMIAGLL